MRHKSKCISHFSFWLILCCVPRWALALSEVGVQAPGLSTAKDLPVQETLKAPAPRPKRRLASSQSVLDLRLISWREKSMVMANGVEFPVSLQMQGAHIGYGFLYSRGYWRWSLGLGFDILQSHCLEKEKSLTFSQVNIPTYGTSLTALWLMQSFHEDVHFGLGAEARYRLVGFQKTYPNDELQDRAKSFAHIVAPLTWRVHRRLGLYQSLGFSAKEIDPSWQFGLRWFL